MIHTTIAGPALAGMLLLIAAAMPGFINKRSFGLRRSFGRRRSIGSGVLAFLANNALLVNITPKGRATAVADAAFTSRYLVAKRGAQYYSIAVAGQGDVPYGVVPDMTPTTDTDLSYPLPVHILGLNEDTERMIASGAIAIDDLVTTDAAGQVRSITGVAPGDYWCLGKARTAAVAQNDQVEVIPCFPFKTTIKINA